MSLTIITNHHRRDVLRLDELPESARADFDYVDADAGARFVHYRGTWYDINDTDGWAPQSSFPGWDTYISDSFFSGIVIKWHAGEYNDYDSATIGRYYA